MDSCSVLCISHAASAVFTVVSNDFELLVALRCADYTPIGTSLETAFHIQKL